MRYTPWGETRWAWELDGGNGYSDRTFTSQRRESPNYVGSLLDYGARFFDSNAGRFISPDTLLGQPNDPRAFNRFAYANNSPVLRNDPSGHIAPIVALVGGAFLLGAVGDAALQVYNNYQANGGNLGEAILNVDLKESVTVGATLAIGTLAIAEAAPALLAVAGQGLLAGGAALGSSHLAGAGIGAISAGAGVSNWLWNGSVGASLSQAKGTLAKALQNAGITAPNVNPTGSMKNCVNCVHALDFTNAGSPASALPSNETILTSRLSEPDAFGGEWIRGVSPGDITSFVKNAGPGARGIVQGVGSKIPYTAERHVFNVRNYRGRVQYQDGQVGLPPFGWSKSYQKYNFLWTHKPE
jgi:RHS repeat-associated protein